MLTYDEICKLLKQKSPFVFVDKVLELEQGKRIVALKCISGSELFPALHFPGSSVYPGIFIIESIAQTVSILCTASSDLKAEGDVQFLALGGIQNFQFLHVVKPGECIRIEAEIIKAVPGMAIVKATVKTGNTVIAKGQMSFGAVKEGKDGQ